MEDFNINSTSLDKSYNNSNIISNYCDYSNITSNNHNYSNITSDYYNYRSINYFSHLFHSSLIIHVVTCAIICISLPLTLVAIYALYSLVQNDHVAPIYVINLLISDLLQLCFMIVEVAHPEDRKISEIFFYIYDSALMASVGFMVCVALERYLVITWPLWYHFRRTIKISVVVCVVVWALPLVYLLPFYFLVHSQVTETIFAVFLLLPFPLLIFFLGGTLKALSASRVPPDEKRRIVGLLVLVLLIYMLLFLPSIIWSLAEWAKYNETFTDLSFMFVQLSPLADLVLYVFMTKGTIDRLLVSVCCSRMDSNEISRVTV